MKRADVIAKPFFDRSDFKPIHGFDGAAVISCDAAPLRRVAFLEQTKRLGIDVAILPGYVWGWDDIISMGMLEDRISEELKVMYDKRPEFDNHLGHIGCGNSHIKIISEAKRLGLKSVIIFEDDAWFVDDWNEAVGAASKCLENVDWHMVYFGTCPMNPVVKFSDNISRMNGGSWALTAYAIHESFYDRILSDGGNHEGPLDIFFMHDAYNPDHKYYIVNKCLNYQRHPEQENTSLIQPGLVQDWDAYFKLINEHYANVGLNLK